MFRKRPLGIGLTLIVAILAAVFCFPILTKAEATGVCYGAAATTEAEAAAVYGGTDANDLWYFAEDALRLADAKRVASGWELTSLSKNDPIVIAVIDTGLNPEHEIFDGVLLRSASGAVRGYKVTVSDSGQVTGEETSAIADDSTGAHGTGVAGVIAMVIKELGLADYIKICPIKANSSSGDKLTFKLAAVVEAIKWASGTLKADVINMSFAATAGTGSTNWATNQALRFAINEALSTSLLVAAAGNEGKNGDVDKNNLYYPAAHDGVIGVMAYDKAADNSFVRWQNSNYGSAYDIAAPGRGILTAGASVLGSSYKTDNGTSLSAAFVSAAAAVLKLKRRLKMEEADGFALAQMLAYLDVDKTTDGAAMRKLNLYAIMEQDFDDTVYDYVPPLDILITHNGPTGTGEQADTIVMKANQVTTVTFGARLTPYGRTNPDYDGMIEWVLTDSKGVERIVGRGTKLDYFATAYGDTVITARLKVGNIDKQTSQKLHIDYLNYYPDDVHVTYASRTQESAQSAPTDGVLYTTEEVEFSLTGLQYLEEQTVKWFVNDAYVATGTVFKFKPKKAGKYVISAQVGDNPRIALPGYAFTATVKHFLAKPLNLAMFLLAIAIVAAVATTAIVIRVKNKKSIKNKS